MDLFDYLAGHPEVATVFNAAMSGNSPAHARLVAATYHCSRMSLVVDVGGGHGRLLATILGGAIPCHRSPRGAPGLHADLEMLVNVGARERTTDEYALLLARSGLRLAQTISLGRPEEPMWHHLIEAQPV